MSNVPCTDNSFELVLSTCNLLPVSFLNILDIVEMDRRGVKYSFVPTQDVHLSLGEDGNYNNMFFLVAFKYCSYKC